MALIRTRQILDYGMEAGGVVHFHTEPPEEGEYYRSYMLMDTDDWRDMGEPDKITITIEPGDLLNV